MSFGQNTPCDFFAGRMRLKKIWLRGLFRQCLDAPLEKKAHIRIVDGFERKGMRELTEIMTSVHNCCANHFLGFWIDAQEKKFIFERHGNCFARFINIDNEIEFVAFRIIMIIGNFHRFHSNTNLFKTRRGSIADST